MKLKAYPFIRLDEHGKFVSASLWPWPTVNKRLDNGGFEIGLPMVEIEVQPLTEAQLRQGAVELLRKTKKEKTAEHVNLMTQMQFQENQLLGLAAPEVLSAELAKRPARSDDAVTDADLRDDGIPF